MGLLWAVGFNVGYSANVGVATRGVDFGNGISRSDKEFAAILISFRFRIIADVVESCASAYSRLACLRMAS